MVTCKNQIDLVSKPLEVVYHITKFDSDKMSSLDFWGEMKGFLSSFYGNLAAAYSSIHLVSLTVFTVKSQICVRFPTFATATVITTHQERYLPSYYILTAFFPMSLQLFRQRLSHESVKAYATMPIGIMGRKCLAFID